MLFKLPKERLEIIDNLVDKLKPMFDKDKDFAPIFEEYEIKFYRGPKLYPSATEIEGVKYIFDMNHNFDITTEFTAGHELGHILLGHTEKNDFKIEREADNFASKLTGHSTTKYASLVFVEVAMTYFNPDHRWAYKQIASDRSKYAHWMVKNHEPVAYK